ncbi:MAG: hypothetical protein M0019_03515 [Actinomycetota bacterium]|nr:hypothetical protein [Actinomycetota bacterium]
MGKFRDIVFGRSQVAKANLDNLFAMPSAAISLEVAANLVTTHSASVCFRAPSGAAFQSAAIDFKSTIAQEDVAVVESTDSLGYSWVTVTADELETLTTAIHGINSTLEDNGFGPSLLCSVFAFTNTTNSKKEYLVYLYKRGTFYPFVPNGSDSRDNARELALQALLKDDLAFETDLERWFALWGLPL